MSPQEYEFAVEELMDKGGIRGMLEAMANVCTDKASHIQSNWQDKALAKRWVAMGQALESARIKAVRLGL